MDDRTTSRPADTDPAVEDTGRLLAPSHALALRLASQGRDEREIARTLDIPVEAVGPLLEVARAKLARIARTGLVALLAALAPQLGRAAVIEVTTLADQAGGPACSLRDAIVAADENAPSGGCPAGDGDDIIGLGSLSGVLALTSSLPSIAGNLAYGRDEAVVIHGPGADRLEITGVSSFGVFRSEALEKVTIEGLTVSEGLGACVYAGGAVTLLDSRVTRCAGAGIDDGLDGIRVHVERSLIDHNDGAAIRVGGGYAGAGGIHLVNSTLSNNEGGGVVIESGEGPGGLNFIYASTLAENASANLSVAVDQRVQIDHTLLKYLARSGVDCWLGGTQLLPPGTPNLQSNASLADDTTCGLIGPRDQEGVAPLLAALADNGGTTPTRALSPGSPAIDGGDTFCAGTDGTLLVDQRGASHPRPVAGTPGAEPRCDVGAFEVPEPERAPAALAALAALGFGSHLRAARSRSSKKGDAE